MKEWVSLWIFNGIVQPLHPAAVTGDQLVHAVIFGCNLTSNARQDGASMPKPVSSVVRN